MTAGFPWTKDQLDTALGQICLQITQGLAAAAEMKAKLDAKTTQELVDLGYDETTSLEVSLIKSAMADLDQLASIFNGDATLATAKSFHTFSDQLLGVHGKSL